MEEGRRESEGYDMRKTTPAIAGFEDGKDPGAPKWGQPLEVEKAKHKILPWSLQRKM